MCGSVVVALCSAPRSMQLPKSDVGARVNRLRGIGAGVGEQLKRQCGNWGYIGRADDWCLPFLRELPQFACRGD